MGVTRRRRPLIVALIGVCGALLACLVWLGVRASLVSIELAALTPLAESAQSAIAAGDASAVSAVAPEIAGHAAQAEALTDEPIWRAAEYVPALGANLGAVRIAAGQLAVLADAAPAVIDATEAVSRRTDGALLDTAALRELAAVLNAAAADTQTADEILSALDTARLVAPVADGISRLQQLAAELRPLAESVSSAAQILPSLLGADEQRSILVMVQNPAELRTGGGITGSFVEFDAMEGAVTLVHQADSSAFPIRTDPIVAIPAATTAIFGGEIGRYVQDATQTPDFALSGEIASAWWSAHTGRTPDTVIALDPYSLEALLHATGPVGLPDGSDLTADNVLTMLLEDAYRSRSSEEQTTLFTSAVAAVFERVASGGIDTMQLLKALQGPAADGRISVWSAAAHEAEILGGSVLGGPLSRHAAAGPGAIAVYLNDATGAKMAGFLDTSLAARTVGCRDDGLAEIEVTVTLGSHAPDDVASLPTSVTGGGLFGVGVGDIGTNVTVMGPAGSYVGAVDVKGEPYPAASAIDDGRAASTARVNLSPGEVNVLRFRLFLPAAGAAAVSLLHTPLMNPAEIDIATTPCG